jgi:hypothetical protein
VTHTSFIRYMYLYMYRYICILRVI